MELKKTKEADLTNRSGLYFLIGLNVVLLLVFLFLEFSRKEVEAPEVVVMPPPPETEEVIITERVFDEPPPPIEAPAPPEIPVEVEPIDNEVEIKEPEKIVNLDDQRPPPTPSTSGQAKPKAPPAKPKPAQQAPPPQDDVDDEVDVRTATKAMVYPGCEKYEGDNRQLYKCFNDEFSRDLAQYIDPNFELDKGEKRKVALSFKIDKNGNLELTGTNGYGAESSFVDNASQAFRSLASKMERRNNRGKGIKPAEGSNGKAAVMKYSIPVVFQPPR